MAGEPPALETARKFLQEERYDQAIETARRRLAVVEAAQGTDSLEAADTLDVLVEALWRGGKARQPETRTLAERALRIRETRLGPEHVSLAPALRSLGMVCREAGEPDNARRFFERALAIRRAALGAEHIDVARSLVNLANLDLATGRYSEAKSEYARALAIAEKTLGPSDPELGWILYNLAGLLRDTAEYDEARPLFERALRIKEETVGPDHPHTARVMDGLAVLHQLTGDYATSRDLYERSLAIRRKAFGPDHLEVASSLNNLAELLVRMGDLWGARRLHEECLAIREKSLGSEDPLVAQSVHNLAGVLAEIGDDTEARSLYERALAIREKALGSRHFTVAQTLDELAALAQRAGHPDEALRLSSRSLDIREEAFGREHLEVAASVNRLARLAAESGDADRSRSLYQRALSIRERALGPDHPDVAETLHGLADLEREAAHVDVAREHYERAIRVRENALGPDHPLVAATLVDYARLLGAAGEPGRAIELGLRAESIARAHLRLTARTLSERQALGYAVSRVSGLDTALSILSRAPHAIAGAEERALDAVIRSRALVQDEMVSRRRAVTGGEDVEVARLAEDLKAARTRLANLTMRGPAGDPPQRYRQLLDEARRVREQAERRLAERSLAFRSALARDEIGLSEIARNLPPRSALLATTLYRQDGRPSYLAFVLRSGETRPILVDLGPAARVDRAIAAWRRDVGSPPPGSAGEGSLAGEADRGSGESLRRLIWDPLAAHLASARLVLVVPDGALNLVNLAALPIGRSEYLLERGPLLHYLSTERDIVRPASSGAGRGGLLALGGPSFDEGSSATVTRGPGSAPSAIRASPFGCDDFSSIHFAPLTAASAEVREIAALWKRAVDADGAPAPARRAPATSRDVEVLTGPEASEAAFKERAPGHRVLHLATHGFFLSGECPRSSDGQRGIGGLAPGPEGARAQGPVNPLLLSGLALSGANQRNDAPLDGEDGVLTADEIATLDLSGVEWAVLSACDTGRGDLVAGEGVLGLRRAFQLAGVATQVMSLWSVEDQAALYWMKALYQARFAEKMGTAEAVRAASLGILRSRRQRHESTNPFFWAAFVAAGEWR